LRRRVCGNGHDDRHDQRVPDQVSSAEWKHGSIEDDEERDRRKAPDQRRPQQAKAHRELRHAGHRNEYVTWHAEGEERLFFHERIEPIRIGKLFQARPHQCNGDAPAQYLEAVPAPLGSARRFEDQVARDRHPERKVVEQVEQVVLGERHAPEQHDAGRRQRHGAARKDEGGDQQLHPPPAPARCRARTTGS